MEVQDSEMDRISGYMKCLKKEGALGRAVGIPGGRREWRLAASTSAGWEHSIRDCRFGGHGAF